MVADMLRAFNAASGVLGLLAGCAAPTGAGESGVTGSSSEALELAPNDRGFAETFHTAGTIDRTNPFIDFYRQRFNIKLNHDERTDLGNFLEAL